MTVLEVTINRKDRWLIGVPDGVVTATVTFAKREEQNRAGRPKLVEELDIHLGGLRVKSSGENEFLRWLKRSLSQGDEIVIRVKSANKCDQPSSVTREKPLQELQRKKRTFEALKKELGGRD